MKTTKGQQLSYWADQPGAASTMLHASGPAEASGCKLPVYMEATPDIDCTEDYKLPVIDTQRDRGCRNFPGYTVGQEYTLEQLSGETPLVTRMGEVKVKKGNN